MGGNTATRPRKSQVIDYVFSLVYAIISLRIVLELMEAREGSAFKRFLDGLSDPLLLPFKGLIPDPSIGPFHVVLSDMAALIVYGLLHMAAWGFIRLVSSPPAV